MRQVCPKTGSWKGGGMIRWGGALIVKILREIRSFLCPFLFFSLYRLLRGFSSFPSCAPRHYWSQMTSRHARVTWHATKMADRVPAKLHLLSYFLTSLFASLSSLRVFFFSLLPEISKLLFPGGCYQDSLDRLGFGVSWIVEFFMAAWFPCASIFASISCALSFALSLAPSYSGPFRVPSSILLYYLVCIFFSSSLVRNSSIIGSLHNQLLINLLSHLIPFFSLWKLKGILQLSSCKVATPKRRNQMSKKMALRGFS